jgi:glycosyl transferase family 25
MKPAATACTLSHIKVWKEILKQELKFAVVLEDDVILSKNFVKQINMLESSIYKLNFDLIKIESSGDKFVALDHSIITSNELEICKFYNSQLGAAGYIISSSFIKQVINKKALYADAIDTLFFTPKSNFLNKYKV